MWTCVQCLCSTTCVSLLNHSVCSRFKVSGELPLLHVKISDQKIHSLLELVDSIPLPNMGSSPSTPTEKVPVVWSSRAVSP